MVVNFPNVKIKTPPTIDQLFKFLLKFQGWYGTKG